MSPRCCLPTPTLLRLLRRRTQVRRSKEVKARRGKSLILTRFAATVAPPSSPHFHRLHLGPRARGPRSLKLRDGHRCAGPPPDDPFAGARPFVSSRRRAELIRGLHARSRSCVCVLVRAINRGASLFEPGTWSSETRFVSALPPD